MYSSCFYAQLRRRAIPLLHQGGGAAGSLLWTRRAVAPRTEGKTAGQSPGKHEQNPFCHCTYPRKSSKNTKKCENCEFCTLFCRISSEHATNMQRTSTGAPEPRAKCAIFADFRPVLVLTGIGVVRHLRAGVRTVGSELDRNTRVAERGPGAALGERKADDPR